MYNTTPNLSQITLLKIAHSFSKLLCVFPCRWRFVVLLVSEGGKELWVASKISPSSNLRLPLQHACICRRTRRRLRVSHAHRKWRARDVTCYCVVVVVCSPSGWDTDAKISILYESMTNVKPDDAFENVIVKPNTRKVRVTTNHHHSTPLIVVSWLTRQKCFVFIYF